MNNPSEALRELKDLMKEAERLAVELDAARDAKPRSPKLTGLPRSGQCASLDLQMEIIEAAERRFEKARERALERLNEIEELIDEIEDYQLQQVLYFRHIYRMKWLDVAERMNYSERTVRRIHTKALNEMARREKA